MERRSFNKSAIVSLFAAIFLPKAAHADDGVVRGRTFVFHNGENLSGPEFERSFKHCSFIWKGESPSRLVLDERFSHCYFEVPTLQERQASSGRISIDGSTHPAYLTPAPRSKR
jgi:hypothetical protein